MVRLRSVSCQDPGWWRRARHGRGFRYLDATGAALSQADIQRVRELAIPPAWQDVRICPHPLGHLQAVGIDDAGRRQYLYHPQWRVQRDVEKFERVALSMQNLPRLRTRVRRDMRAKEGNELVERRRVLAAGIRMLDLGCFRPGSETSADVGNHGLTTLERQHMRRDGEALWFRFDGKSGVAQDIRIEDADVVRVVTRVTARRSASSRVLASRVAGRWSAISPDELNERIHELAGAAITAKDFRTWHATTTAAATLAEPPLPTSQRARQRRIREAIEAASTLLGNTPTVARSAYVDPRVIELFDRGVVIDPVPNTQNALDQAVSMLLSEA